MKIVLLCEGRTESVIATALKTILDSNCKGGKQIRLQPIDMRGHLKQDKLRRLVDRHGIESDVIGIVALTDVFPNYLSAAHAKESLKKMMADSPCAVRFHPHVARHDVEAWLIPHWGEIAKRIGVKVKPPGAKPEEINTTKPPSVHIKELYRKAKQKYDKVIDGPKWLTAKRIEIAAKTCPELQSFLGTLKRLASEALEQ